MGWMNVFNLLVTFRQIDKEPHLHVRQRSNLEQETHLKRSTLVGVWQMVHSVSSLYSDFSWTRRLKPTDILPTIGSPYLFAESVPQLTSAMPSSQTSSVFGRLFRMVDAMCFYTTRTQLITPGHSSLRRLGRMGRSGTRSRCDLHGVARSVRRERKTAVPGNVILGAIVRLARPFADS
jgi:hypothetical protein